MGIEKYYIQNNHNKTIRNYFDRMKNNKVDCMKIARKFDYDFWDGERKFGYGGYNYIDNYWTSVAKHLIEDYSLGEFSKVLDVGCGKGFLLFELKKLIPSISISGFDISEYSIINSKPEIKKNLFVHDAGKKTNFSDNQFDLTFSFGTLHNLHINSLFNSIKEIDRISKNSYIMVEGYRNEQELFNLQCWALTCNSFYSKQDWLDIFNIVKYPGDYEFIYF